jgi:hypothetical protein
VIRTMLRSLASRHPIFDRLRVIVRGRLQERDAARSQARCEREVARRNLAIPQGAALRAALRDRLASSPHPPWPKRKGELHVFLACWIYNWEVVLPESLAPFGRVTHFDWTEAGFDSRSPDWLSQRDAMNEAMLEAFDAAHREQPVDVVVGYLSGGNTAPETLERMARRGCAIVNFCFDDKLHFPGVELGGRPSGPAPLAAQVDLNLTNAPGSLVKYAAYGGLALFWPQGAQPGLHRPHETPFEFDVSFVGGAFGWRPVLIERIQRLLAPAGVELACFGPGWPAGPLSDEELVRLYSRSRINLGFGGVASSRRLTCLKGRDFEVPMSGGLYLTQHNPELERVFDISREIVTYRDEADCARIIRELLADPERAAAIRRAGRARCLRDHTWEQRWAQVFELAGVLETEPDRREASDLGDPAAGRAEGLA